MTEAQGNGVTAADVKNPTRIVSLLLLLAIVQVFGCRGDSVEATIRDANQNNAQRLANLYGSFQSNHGWVGPKDKEEFLAFINSLHANKLERIGIDPSKIEELFISTHDNQELKIRYGIVGGRGACAPVVFESEGVDGKRWVGFTAMRYEEVDEARYQELWDGKHDNAATERTGTGGERPQ